VSSNGNRGDAIVHACVNRIANWIANWIANRIVEYDGHAIAIAWPSRLGLASPMPGV